MKRGEAAGEVSRVRICTAVEQGAHHVFPCVFGGVMQRRHFVGVCSFQAHAVPKSPQHAIQVSPSCSREEFLFVRSGRAATRRSSRLAPQEKVSTPHLSVFSHTGPDARIATEQRARTTQRIFFTVSVFPKFTVEVRYKFCRLRCFCSTDGCIIVTHTFSTFWSVSRFN